MSFATKQADNCFGEERRSGGGGGVGGVATVDMFLPSSPTSKHVCTQTYSIRNKLVLHY